ncbi:hypothetical protein ScPMuIL_001925 [Solemya velum]
MGWARFGLFSFPENLGRTFRRKVTQSSTHDNGQYSTVAENAVDGDYSQKMSNGHCTHTATNQKRAWWSLELNGLATIQTIKIWLRNDSSSGLKRFRGTDLYISNETDCGTGELVYRQDSDPTNPWQSTYTIRIAGISRYIHFCNEVLHDGSADVQLCEIEAMGCPYGKYGTKCINDCGNCERSTCNLKNGDCSGQCEAGYTGSQCKESCNKNCKVNWCSKNGNCIGDCANGFYGSDCSNECAKNCKNRQCTRYSHMCMECEDGFWGEMCDTTCLGNCNGSVCEQMTGVCLGTCSTGFWGQWCNMTCSSGCFEQTCDSHNGFCSEGCSDGFWGALCTDTCSPNCKSVSCNRIDGSCSECNLGFYGEKCELNCSNQCKDKNCSQKNGLCVDGCMVGYHGKMCLDECSANCKNLNCDQDTANCEPCIDGYWGGKCGRDCPLGCHDKRCDQASSACTSGCEATFWGSYCDKRGHLGCIMGKIDQEKGICTGGCVSGYWGVNCTKSCPLECLSGTCTKEGTCDSGCNAGYAGASCTQKCQDGSYGNNCENQCGSCKGGETCFHINGTCLSGCGDGYVGELCQTAHMALKEANIGFLAGGFAATAAIVFIVVIVIFFFIRKRKRGRGHLAPVEPSPKTDANGIEESSVELKSKFSYKRLLFHIPMSSLITGQTDIYVNVEGVQPSHGNTGNSGGYLATSEDADHVYVNTTGDTEMNYYNLTNQTRGIPIEGLKEYIEKKTDKKYELEFKELPTGSMFPRVIGQQDENNTKNRFLTIIPYDHARVCLEKASGDPNSDYINASYIDGMDTEKTYIAAQGPKPTTIADTWRMIMQEKCGVVVMLTNLVEDGKKKCERYWPLEGEKMTFGSIMLSLASEEEHDVYTIRNIDVTLTANGVRIRRRLVIQFHYSAWPDHDVADPRQLVVFHRRLLQTKSTLSGPLLVHCSAGVGRSGTFIALDALLTYGRKNKEVDIMGYVAKMRRSRISMIQTVEQYKLLHEALFEALMYPGSAIQVSDFPKQYEKLKLGAAKKENNILASEFKLLQSMRPNHTVVDFASATMKDNMKKNRDLKLLPLDKYRPYLRTFVSGTTNYINAVMIPNVRSRKFLVTQMPMDRTVVDFWRMVFDHDSNTIIVLNISDPKKVCWHSFTLPENDKPLEFGHLMVELTSTEKTSDNITEYTVSLIYKKSEKRTLRVFSTDNWSSQKELPPSKDTLIAVIESVNKWQLESGNSSITVQCMNGITGCGVYCAVSNLIERIKVNQEVDVFQVIREIQIRSPQMIQSEAQYKFCYDCVSEYLSTGDNDIYVNL